jgi:hypothetical protein
MEEIPDQHLAATAARSSQGLSSVEDAAFAMFPDIAVEEQLRTARTIPHGRVLRRRGRAQGQGESEIIGIPHGA